MARLSPQARAFLVAFFVLYNAFAFARVVPMNWSLPENHHHVRGDLDYRVTAVFEGTRARAELPFSEVRNHALYFDRNPGMFMLVSELFIRAGADSPLPIQLFTQLLWNVGLWFCFLWLREVFGSERFAAVGLTFLLSTPFLLHHTSSIQHGPYVFCFVHIAFYALSRYLQRGRETKWLVLCCAAYFLACQSYWMYYMSTWLLLQAIQLKLGRFSWKLALITAAPPVAAFITTFLQVVYAQGGFEAAYMRLADILAARTGDWRIEGAKWNPDKTYVKASHLARYHEIVFERVADLMGYPVSMFVAMLGSALALGRSEGLRRYLWLLPAALAGLSWNLVMVQHTVIHEYAGMYGYMFWTLVVCVFFDELYRALDPARARGTMLALCVPLAFFALDRQYIPYLTRYANNIVAGEVVDQMPVKKKKKKKVKSKKFKMKDKNHKMKDDSAP